MNRSGGAARKLPEDERKALAVRGLAGSESITDLAGKYGVSRKFVYEQTHRASVALDEAFPTAVNDDDEKVLFELKITRRVLCRMILALMLICRGSYRGVIEFMRDLLGVHISEGTVHNVLEAAAAKADVINRATDLSAVRVGLHDELFQGPRPVLAGVDAKSTFCYLLAAEAHRDGDTWGVHLLDAKRQGLNPDYTIADAGQGARAGQAVALEDTPCHGDVFHIQHQFESLANTLARIAQGHQSRCRKLQAKIEKGHLCDRAGEPAVEIDLARKAGARSQALARDVRTLNQWLAHDVLSLAGPAVAARQDLYDFIAAELQLREHEDVRRIRPMRVALQNQRDDLLAFARVLDDKLADVAKAHDVSEHLVRQVYLLHRKPSSSTAYWKRWNRLRSKLTNKFHLVFDALVGAMASTPRCSSLVENLNSRLRTYFTLRRHLGSSYLALLQFFLNHRRFMRSRVGRKGKSPRELMTGQEHPHWFTLLGLGEPQPLLA